MSAQDGRGGQGHGHGPGGHGHGHGHGGHGHGHGGRDSAAAPSEPEAHRAPLTRGAGGAKRLHLDAASGVAGDMTVAALVDLGVPLAVVEAAIAELRLPGVVVGLDSVFAGAIGASRFRVEPAQSERDRHYSEIDELIARSSLAPDVIDLSRRIFRRLAEAESRVHRIDIGSVTFHEVGAVDAIVDIVGAAACFEYLGAAVSCSPLPLGHGFVDCRHGVLPLPAPATVECLLGVPTFDAGIEAELVTPTGAAIVATVAESFVRWPALSVERVGWGAGSRELPDRPNALRAVLGQPLGTSTRELVVVEANVDDLTGELAAHAIAELLRAGALDAWATPATMKKGRPGLLLHALGEPETAERLAQLLLRETTTLGVRAYVTSRVERPRRLIEVATRFGVVPVKISGGALGPEQVKPEFDVCAALAREHGVPVREVIAEAVASVRSLDG